MSGGVLIRRARRSDVTTVATLVCQYADEQLMLPRTREVVSLMLDDYVVAVDERDRVIGCGALREYSPSVAEVASIAVGRDWQGRGVGRAIVEHVERLARVRGYGEVFLVTVTPAFFEAIGYVSVAPSAYPEKRCAHERSMAACDDCDKVCMWRAVADQHLERAA